MDFRDLGGLVGARPSPGTDEHPGGYSSDSDQPHPQTCPGDARVPHWARPYFVAADGKKGWGCWGLMGWWVMVTQIMPHHTAYLQLTPNSAANSGAETQTELIGGVGFVSSYNFEVRHVFLWLLM